jgi:hypothetical protein
MVAMWAIIGAFEDILSKFYINSPSATPIQNPRSFCRNQMKGHDEYYKTG